MKGIQFLIYSILLLSSISIIYSIDPNDILSMKKIKLQNSNNNPNNNDNPNENSNNEFGDNSNVNNNSNMIEISPDNWLYIPESMNNHYFHEKLNRKLLLRRLLSQLNSNGGAFFDKEKREDDIPPGFIGVRGRRLPPPQYLQDYRAFVPLVPINQKKDAPSIYKDGFLGVRG